MKGSIPKKPVLGKGWKWTAAQKKRIHMRWLQVGWADLEIPAIGIAYARGEGDPYFIGTATDGPMHDQLNGPCQIVKIGPPFTPLEF